MPFGRPRFLSKMQIAFRAWNARKCMSRPPTLSPSWIFFLTFFWTPAKTHAFGLNNKMCTPQCPIRSPSCTFFRDFQHPTWASEAVDSVFQQGISRKARKRRRRDLARPASPTFWATFWPPLRFLPVAWNARKTHRRVPNRTPSICFINAHKCQKN